MKKLVCKCNLKYGVIFFFTLKAGNRKYDLGTACLDECLLSLVMLIPACVTFFRVLEVGQQRDSCSAAPLG